MKKILVGLLVLGSFSAFSADLIKTQCYKVNSISYNFMFDAYTVEQNHSDERLELRMQDKGHKEILELAKQAQLNGAELCMKMNLTKASFIEGRVRDN